MPHLCPVSQFTEQMEESKPRVSIKLIIERSLNTVKIYLEIPISLLENSIWVPSDSVASPWSSRCRTQLPRPKCGTGRHQCTTESYACHTICPCLSPVMQLRQDPLPCTWSLRCPARRGHYPNRLKRGNFVVCNEMVWVIELTSASRTPAYVARAKGRPRRQSS